MLFTFLTLNFRQFNSNIVDIYILPKCQLWIANQCWLGWADTIPCSPNNNGCRLKPDRKNQKKARKCGLGVSSWSRVLWHDTQLMFMQLQVLKEYRVGYKTFDKRGRNMWFYHPSVSNHTCIPFQTPADQKRGRHQQLLHHRPWPVEKCHSNGIFYQHDPSVGICITISL